MLRYSSWLSIFHIARVHNCSVGIYYSRTRKVSVPECRESNMYLRISRTLRAICLQTSKNVIRFIHFTLSYVITSKCTSFSRRESQSSQYRNIDCQVLSSFRSCSTSTWGSQRCIYSRIIAYQKDKLSALASVQQQVSILLNEGTHSPCFSVIQRSRYWLILDDW